MLAVGLQTSKTVDYTGKRKSGGFRAPLSQPKPMLHHQTVCAVREASTVRDCIIIHCVHTTFHHSAIPRITTPSPPPRSPSPSMHSHSLSTRRSIPCPVTSHPTTNVSHIQRGRVDTARLTRTLRDARTSPGPSPYSKTGWRTRGWRWWRSGLAGRQNPNQPFIMR